MTEKTSLPCRKILDLLPRFIENDFSPEESEAVLDHLRGCAPCREEYEAMVHLVEVLEATPAVGVPPSFKDAVMKILPPTAPGEEEK